MRVPLTHAEQARALMLQLAPEGFEERERGDVLELAAYTDSLGGARIARAFGVAREDEVPSDWAQRWRAFHRPVRVGPFWIGPSWESVPADAIAVVVDPGLAFGTGAHATTRLCLELLAELPPCALLDAGCGSGVLAVAAAKLSFDPVHALDDDPLAVETAAANAAANGVAIDVRVADVTAESLPAVDAVVANIATEAVEALAARVAAGTLIASGYLERERPHVAGWTHVERRVREGWAADRYARSQ